MKPTLEYSRYQEWGGMLDEAAFKAQRSAAYGIVNHLIGYNATDGHEGEYLDAVCAAIEARATAEETGRGFSLGSFSVDGDSSIRPEEAAERAAIAALVGTGLLWQGL